MNLYNEIELLSPAGVDAADVRVFSTDVFSSGALSRALARVQALYVGIVTRTSRTRLVPDALVAMVEQLHEHGARACYADYVLHTAEADVECRTNDPERHVVRDSFDFGPVVVARTADVRSIVASMPQCSLAAIYGVLLGLQRLGSLHHAQLLVGTVIEDDNRAAEQKQFDYVSGRQAAYQKELEALCTHHLQIIGALVSPADAAEWDASGNFSVKASVVIPVRNRVKTIADAVHSALSQVTSFDFNVVVVDNHSTDGTSDVLRQLAAEDFRVVHIIPQDTSLGIGGCWNVAINSSLCGQYAVQLDSDDLYSDQYTLQTMVDKFDERGYAMVIGSYKLVDFDLNTLPPGVIDHREWTDDNGANNALRINGLGAPRAFSTSWLRANPLPNVSYGEDYAAGLAATRAYLLGRIFSPLYLCRRWGGNSDAGLNLQQQAANNAYKDRLRSDEVDVRIRMKRS